MTPTNDTSIGDKVVEWVVYALQTFGKLPYDLTVTPFVSSLKAPLQKLVVKCETGAQYLEADQGFHATLTLTYRTVERDAAKANDVWAKVESMLTAGLQTAGSNSKALETFARLDLLTEEAENSTSNTGNHREFSRTIPLHVKLL